MDFFRAKLITSLLAYGFIVSALVGGILYYQFPNFYPNWFEGILLFYLILETLIIVFVEASSRKATSKQLLNVYMLTKVVKIFAALIFVGAYALAVKENIKSFVLIFMVFYLLYLGIEAILFLKIEKRLKNKQQ